MNPYSRNQCRKHFPGPFTVAQGRDGVDETCDVVCLTTGQCLASTYYWDQRDRALFDASVVAQALNACLIPGYAEVMPATELASLKRFCRAHPGPYIVRRARCPYRGPCFGVTCTVTGYDLIDSYGSLFDRRALRIANAIAAALNELDLSGPLEPPLTHAEGSFITEETHAQL